MSSAQVSNALKALSNKEYADHAMGFFKTGPGQYGEGDKFLGIRVPVIRAQVKSFKHTIVLEDMTELLQSPWHEVRMFALLSMVDLYKRSDHVVQRKLVSQYLKHKKSVNNWDLVDCSAHAITGPWFFDKDRQRLDKLICSNHLWDRRIAMISTLYYIRQHDLTDTFKYSEQLLSDSEDLMHKASGWMLREAGKRDETALHRFIDTNIEHMPRTMLRYAIEKFPEKTRKAYLNR